ncbi:MAG: CsbD family protein [Ornithinimicrobium sp.]
MGIADKISNSSEDAKGNAKEAAGDATGNEQMQAEGKADQGKADMKQTGEKAKDAFNDATK